MAMPYLTGIDFGYDSEFDFSNTIEFPSDCSFSKGCSLQTSQRYSYDYSKTSQSLTRCKRKSASTFTIEFNQTLYDYMNLFERLALFEDCVGKTGRLFYCGYDMGLCIILNASFTLAIDNSNVINGIKIQLSLSEALIKTKRPSIVISTL